MNLKITKPRVAGLIFCLFLLNGALLTAYNYGKAKLYTDHARLGEVAVNEMGAAVCGAASLAGLFWLFTRASIRPTTTPGWVALHGVGSVLYSVLHTTSYWGIRSLLYPALGYGTYDPGSLVVRYLMELPNDVLTYLKWLLLLLVFQYYRRLRDREQSLAEAQLENLQKQLQPHFLMNSLNAISSLIYSNPKAADEMIARLGAFLRRSFLHQGAQQVLLSEEIASVQDYVDVMQMRYGDRLKCRFDIPAATSSAKVPPLSLQPLVENSLIHGASPTDLSIEIDITAREAGNCIEVAVRDRGKGFKPDARPGVGLRNLSSRMTALYGDKGSVQIDSAAGGGAIVRLLVPQHG